MKDGTKIKLDLHARHDKIMKATINYRMPGLLETDREKQKTVTIDLSNENLTKSDDCKKVLKRFIETKLEPELLES